MSGAAGSPTKGQPGPADAHRHHFELDLAAAGLRVSRITVSARLPDGRLEALPDAPLLLARAVPAIGEADSPPAAGGASMAAAALPEPAPVAIVVPVYRGREETIACLESVLATIDTKTRLVVVNDGSPEPDLVQALEAFAATGAIDLLRNEQNRDSPPPSTAPLPTAPAMTWCCSTRMPSSPATGSPACGGWPMARAISAR